MGLLTDAIKKSQFLRKIFFGFAVALAATDHRLRRSGRQFDTPHLRRPPCRALAAADVTALVQAAAQAADPNTMVIAVVDRAGNVLGVYRKPSAPALATGNFSAQVDVNELAVSLARTGAFFSNDQAPLSSRTVRFISGIHFPPGIANTPNAPLYGIENTNRGCTLSTNFIAGQSVPPARSISGATTGLGITTGKVDVNDSDPTAVNPGGVPLFRNGSLVGGIGVAGVAPDVAEYAAYAAATSNGFGPTPAAPGVVFIGGVALPFVNQTTPPAGTSAGSFTGSFIVGPSASPGAPPEGMLVAPAAGPLGGLAASEVTTIINNAIANGEYDARRDSSAHRFFRAHGDCRRRSRRHDHRPVPHGGQHSVQHRRSRDQSPQHGVLQQRRPVGRRFDGRPDGHGRHQPHDRLRRPAIFSSRN